MTDAPTENITDRNRPTAREDEERPERSQESPADTRQRFIDDFLKVAEEKSKDKTQQTEPKLVRSEDKSVSKVLAPLWIDGIVKPKDVSDPAFKPALRGRTDLAPSKTVTIDDGTYRMDKEGRITSTRSKDGKHNRSFEYNDRTDPKRITGFTINDTKFRYEGQVTSGGHPLYEDGLPVSSYTAIRDGKELGRWNGKVSIDAKSGVLSASKLGEPIKQRGADGKVLSDTELQKRNSKGIWSEDGGKDKDQKDKDQKDKDDGKKEQDKDKSDKKPDIGPGIGRRATLSDGTYTRNKDGQITETLSKDGKTKRTFQYNNEKFPDRPDVTIGDTKYQYLGPCTYGDGKVCTDKNGRQIGAYAMYDKKGNLTGNWSGVMEIDKKSGVFTMGEDGTDAKHFGASNNELTRDEHSKRQKSGIWPQQFKVERADGSTLDVKLEGTDLKSVTETTKDKGKDVVTTWTRKPSPGNEWQSNPDTKERRFNMRIDDAHSLHFTDSKNIEHVIKKDGTQERITPDRTRIELNKNQQPVRLTSADGHTRSFDYDKEGKVTKITDVDKNKVTKVWDASDSKAEKREKVAIDKNSGDVSWQNPDKSAVIAKANFSRLDIDKDGKITKATQHNGNTREFKYDKAGELEQVKDTRKSGDKEKVEIWARHGGDKEHPNFRQVDEHGKPIKGRDGKERVRNDVHVRAGGDLEYKGTDGKIKTMPADGRDAGLSANVEEARDNLFEVMKEHLDGPRLKRFQDMVKAFETRMANRTAERKLAGVKSNEEIDAHHEKTVAETYNSLAKMVQAKDPDATYDQKTRVKLAENFMFHAQEPMTVDQGPEDGREGKGHGTCWISSASIWGLTQHPGAMADYLQQIAVKGQYTTKNSGTPGNPLVGEKGDSSVQRTVKFSKDYLSFSGKQENEWSISTATEKTWRKTDRGLRESEGDRSPVSRIFESTLPILAGTRAEGDVDGGTYSSFRTTGNRPYIGNKDLMFMVTGDTPADMSYTGYSDGHLIDGNLAKTMLEKGTILSYSPGHMKSQTIRKMPDGSYGYFQDNQHGESDDKQTGKFANFDALKQWLKDGKGLETITPKAVKFTQFKIDKEPDFGPVKARGSKR